MTSTTTTTNDPAESYIVKLKDHPSVDIKQHIQAFAAKFNQNNQVHYKVTHEWSPSFVKAYVGTFSPHVLAELKRHGDVEYVSENSEVGDFQIVDQKDANGNDNAGWGLSRINRNEQLTGDPASVNFPYRYDGSLETGAGVDIYILDTGIKIDHEDFGGRAIWGTTIDKKEGDVDDDKDGHGTHVAGIAGGTRWGVAKGATLIAVKHNGGQVEHFVKGIEWIITSAKSRQRPSVVNMSHGVPKRNRFWNETVTKVR
ncbi:hypothetical protein CVT26_009100 [Gymnopilus dilepis]|uniref:Peptidase S8/S53 domain-containing protein n=1 Tax=Gymnopilus dilepis TaxID=231916 RepID=A0A409WCI7_9AGAR|nr:hypothetical protein CVT26_009100 [Gymnopilus dilepis]